MSATSSSAAARLCLGLLRRLYCRGASRAGARVSMNLLGRKRLTAFRAHHDRIEVLAAFAVLMQQRPPAGVDHVRVTPVHDCHHDWIEIEPFLGENVFMSFGRLLIGKGNAAQVPDLALDSGPGTFTLLIRVTRRLTKMRSKSFEGVACSIAGAASRAALSAHCRNIDIPCSYRPS